MAKCYYCGGAGCSQCRKMTKSSYGADAVTKAPSPNGANKPIEAAGKKSISDELRKELEKAIARRAAPKKKLYGWISQQHSRHSPSVVYGRPDGSEVKVSFVTYSPVHHGTGWTDCQCIGEVTEYIRHA